MRADESKKTRAGKRRVKGKGDARAAFPAKPSSAISATQAARTFSDLLNRVRYRGETFIIERGGATGVPVGPHDLIIAATAMGKGYKVASRDERSFPEITGLSFLHW